MGRKRKKANRGLPKGVYRDGKTFRNLRWNGKQLINGGCGFKTPEEADYFGFLKHNGHHWRGLEKGRNMGFIYKITSKVTGKEYIGSKQFLLWDGPQAGYKCYDMDSEWFDERAWRDNDWTEYTGSSDELNAEISKGNIWDYTFEVLEMCKTRLDIHVSEVLHQMERDVLEAVGEDGEYLYYNKNIASKEFRAPFKKSNLVDVREREEESMRNYYLKPRIDSDGNVIPYGNRPVSLETGGFTDVR